MDRFPEQFRALFTPMRDLNLIVLIHALEARRVRRGQWVWGAGMCPMQHTGIFTEDWFNGKDQKPSIKLVADFVGWWDTDVQAEASGPTLLRFLRSLWEERRADADAVQWVITAPSAESSAAPNLCLV